MKGRNRNEETNPDLCSPSQRDTSIAWAQDNPLLMQTPTLSKTQIVFSLPAICGLSAESLVPA